MPVSLHTYSVVPFSSYWHVKTSQPASHISGKMANLPNCHQESPIKISGWWCFRMPRRLVLSYPVGSPETHWLHCLLKHCKGGWSFCLDPCLSPPTIWASEKLFLGFWAPCRWTPHPSAQSFWSSPGCHFLISKWHPLSSLAKPPMNDVKLQWRGDWHQNTHAEYRI